MLTLGREELGSEGELLLGVFDGHGKYGEDCASIARERSPRRWRERRRARMDCRRGTRERLRR